MTMDKTLEHRLAWLAGIIDGEGWIGVRIESNNPSDKTRRSGKTFYAAGWYIGVANTDPGMIIEIMSIADVIGARYRFDRLDRRTVTRRSQTRVTFHTKRDCEALLKAIFPFLVTKKPQAELMLRAIAHRQAKGHCRRPGWVPVMDDAPFLEMFDGLRALNQRGPRT